MDMDMDMDMDMGRHGAAPTPATPLLYPHRAPPCHACTVPHPAMHAAATHQEDERTEHEHGAHGRDRVEQRAHEDSHPRDPVDCTKRTEHTQGTYRLDGVEPTLARGLPDVDCHQAADHHAEVKPIP